MLKRPTATTKLHYHKLRCRGCNFPLEQETCDCGNPAERWYICYECSNDSMIKQGKKQ